MRLTPATLFHLSLGILAGVIVVAAVGQQVSTPPATEPTTQITTGPATRPAADTIPSTGPAARTALTDEQGKTVEGVRLSIADLRAVVRGSLVQVTLTLTFQNDRGHILGGELMFPLPDGATVNGYGLDVNGQMVDGVAVDQQEARDIYQTESSRRVDPGLVEHVSGNAFRTRLYPVPAHGSRSARVQYVTEVNTSGAGTTLSLPMAWAGVEKWTATIESPEAAAEPAVPFAAGVVVDKLAHVFVASGARVDAPRELIVRFAAPPGRSVTIEQWSRGSDSPESVTDAAIANPADLTGRRGMVRGRRIDLTDKPAKRADILAATGEQKARLHDYESYFVLNDTPPALEEPAPQAAADLRAKPVRRLAIMWDAGLSNAPVGNPRQGRDSKELKLLASLLKGWAGATGDLVVFRNAIESPIHFELGTPDGGAEVIRQIESLTYDGASDIAHLPLAKNVAGFINSDRANALNTARPTGNYDCLLLFTNCADDSGPREILRAPVPVYAFSDDPSTGAGRVNHGLLQRICRDSGGRYFNLSNFSGNVPREPWSLLSVEFDPADVTDVYPFCPVAVEGSGHLTLTGRLLAPTATVTLNYGYDGHVMHRQPFMLNASEGRPGALAPRFWAQQKVAELSLEPDVNAKELRNIGRHFNLVTPNTSLLVLETVDQYVRYNVVPPKSQAELYAAYMARTELNWSPFAEVPGQPILPPALYGWESQVKWWEDPRAYVAPPALVEEVNRHPVDEGPRDARSSERRMTEQHSGAVRQSRQLLREAMQARQAGDTARARDLYAEVITLDPGNPAAVQGQSDLRDGMSATASPRERLAEQAERRKTESAAVFRAALDRASQDIDHHDLEGADSEIDAARAALDSSISAYDSKERQEFEAWLTDAKQRIDAARLVAATDARSTRETAIAEAHARRSKEEIRSGINQGRSHRYDYGEQLSGSAGAGSGLFGGGGSGGGEPAPTPPPPRPMGSKSLPPAGSAPTQSPPPASNQPDSASLESPSAWFDRSNVCSSVIHPWDPAPYMSVITRASAKDAYAVYLEQRAIHGNSPEFYLDCGDYLERLGQHDMSQRVVSNVAAFHVVDANFLRRSAYRLAELGDLDRAVDLFDRVLQLAPQDMPAYRDLALALSDRADARAEHRRGHGRLDDASIAADYHRCLELLDHVIEQPIPPEKIVMVCLMDANRVIARVRRLEDAGEIPPVAVPLDPRLIRNLECDLRVVMTCDTDEADASLTVREPDGSVASDSPHATPAGGRIEGIVKAHGPQEYCLRSLLPGTFRVAVNVLAGHGQDSSGPCTVRLSIFTDFGRAGEQRKSLSVRVTEPHAAIDVDIVAARGPGSAERKAALAALRAHDNGFRILGDVSVEIRKPAILQSTETSP